MAKIERLAGFVVVRLLDEDFKIPKSDGPGMAWVEFIERIKARIPLNERDYDSETKTWFIKEEYFDLIVGWNAELLIIKNENQLELFS